MGEILNELLLEIKSSDIDEKVRIICDRIISEEKDNITCPKYLMEGPNVFLCLDVPGRTSRELSWLALERESKEKYIIRLWTKRKRKPEVDKDGKEIETPIKISSQWSINENSPEKILKQYVEKLKYLKGE